MATNMISLTKFKTDVGWMDDHHSELIDMTLELINAMARGDGERKVSGMLEFLDRYVYKHFSIEDALMRKLEYFDMKSHLAEHKSFIFTLNNLKKELRSTGSSIYLAGNVKRHLLDWLVNHIGETDRGFAKFLLEKGMDKLSSSATVKPLHSYDRSLDEEKKYC